MAAKFGLNAENCPKHPSFCNEAWVKTDLVRGEVYFILEDDREPVACVAFEDAGGGLAYLNRLSVLLTHRRRGFGERLVRHVVAVAATRGMHVISIGVIGEHRELQRWYRKFGFVGGETKRFAHLPFSVHYMIHSLADESKNS
ncbi:MAG: GNAT family N-acetyltransferase [Paracoccaceae bacterium]